MKEISITSFDNLQIGQAENTAAGTGCTVVLLGKDGAPAGLDARGGGPASRESELLKPLAAAQAIHAIVLAGGSAFGLDAAGGVQAPRQYVRIGSIGESPWNDPARLPRQTCVEACLPDVAYGNPHAEKIFIILKLRKARCVGNKSKKFF